MRCRVANWRKTVMLRFSVHQGHKQSDDLSLQQMSRFGLSPAP